MVYSEPPGAHIWANDDYQGKTPCTVGWNSEGRGGQITVEAFKNGYVPEVKEVDPEVHELHFALQPVGSDRQVPSPEGGDSLPPPEEFVPYDELPVAIKEVQPEYPPLAKQAGIEGVVWVKALVDKSGKVRDAIIFKPSGASAGFEAAALRAAYQREYKPAISDGKPVAIWVTYPVRFLTK
jgi:protein TonB